MKTISLWVFNRVTGYWNLVRNCDVQTAQDWMRIFQTDDPGAVYQLSKTKPRKEPTS